MTMTIDCAYDAIVDIETLEPHPRNTNEHPDEQIDFFCKVLKYQGQRRAVVVSNLSRCITKGHGLVLSAKKNGWDKIAVDYQDYEDEAQEYADIEADNHLAKLAVHNKEKMYENLREVHIEDFDHLGIPDFEMPPDDEERRQEIEDEVPDVTESISKLGDVYYLGDHILVCGDSTDPCAVDLLMHGEKADMVFTDPPYGVAIKNTKGEILGDQSLDVFGACLPRLYEYAKESAHIYIYFGVQYTKECLGMMGEHFKQNNILVQKITHENKPSPTGYFKSNYELCYFSNPSGRPFNHGHTDVSESTLNDSRYKGDGRSKTYSALTDIKATEHNLKSIHPTQKTVAICEFYQNISSNKSDSVLDLFGGSGSTLIACEKTNRKCFMMELDPHYIDVIVTRWCKYTNTTSIKRNGEAMEWTLGQDKA